MNLSYSYAEENVVSYCVNVLIAGTLANGTAIQIHVSLPFRYLQIVSCKLKINDSLT